MSMGCGDVRELYFELRHGNVDGPTQGELEAHLLRCAACQEHVEKLDTMLDEALLWQPEAEPLDREALFAGILGELDEEQAPLVVLAPSPRGERRGRMLPWLRITLAAAALVVATMSWPKVILEFVSGESDTIFKELGAVADVSSEVEPEGFVAGAESEVVEAIGERPGPLSLRLNAERALREGSFQEAAGYYEELLGVLPAGDRAGGSIRLNLARIYQVHLQDGARAAEHLRVFAATWPDDPVTPQALAEICLLAPSVEDRHCRH